MPNLSGLVTQLKKERDRNRVQQQLTGLNAALAAFAGVYRNTGTKPRRTMSAKARARIAAAQREHAVKDRVQNLSRRAGHAIYGQEDHTVRNAISFAAGIGLGIGVGMLLAPSPGEETRSSIVGKVHGFGDKVRERFSPEVKKPATGTEGM
jgi:ElaB/YqjD/DUF883 family membrane-anchored ribosome-binding protein